MTARTSSPVVALVAAAGRGTRLGAEIPKAYVQLRGRSLLERSVTAMETSEIVDQIGVIVSPDMEPLARRLLRGHDVRFIHGAGERADSVWEGLQALSLNDEAPAHPRTVGGGRELSFVGDTQKGARPPLGWAR